MSYIVYEDRIEPKDMPGRSLKWLFASGEDQFKNFTMNVVTIKPGCTVKPAHSHPLHEEVVYIITGNGKAFIDGTVYEIRMGAALFFSPGSIHMLANTGTVDMKAVCFFTPPATLDDYTFHNEINFPELS